MLDVCVQRYKGRKINYKTLTREGGGKELCTAPIKKMKNLKSFTKTLFCTFKAFYI